MILLGGDQGADWLVYNNTDRSSIETFGRAQVLLSAECCTYQQGSRLATQPAGAVRPGERVLVERNGGQYLSEVLQADSRTVRVRDVVSGIEHTVTPDRILKREVL